MTSITRTQRIVSTTFLALVGALPLAAQDTSPSHLARARELAGTQFVTTEQIMCREPSAMHDIPTDLASARGAKATKVFDNLYYIGSQGVGAWIVTTSDGIIMLNAMFTPSVKSTLLPGFKSLGLDPQNVKDVVITDPHADHYGGANYLQDSIGARVYMTAADWQAMLANGDREPREGGNRGRGAGQGANGRGTGLGGGGGGTSGGLGGGRGGRGGGGGGGFGGGRNGGGSNGTQRADPFAEKAVVNFTPHRDLVAASGDTLVLGDEVLTFVQSPDKSAGTLSVLIPVKEGGSQHLAALLGGTANAPTDILKRTQLAAARALSDAAVAAHADVALSAYPFIDNAIARMDTVRKRKPGAANPFILGADGVTRYLGVIKECAAVAVPD